MTNDPMRRRREACDRKSGFFHCLEDKGQSRRMVGHGARAVQGACLHAGGRAADFGDAARKPFGQGLVEDRDLEAGRTRIHHQYRHQSAALIRPMPARPAKSRMAKRRKSCGSVFRKWRPPSQLPRKVRGSAMSEAQSVSQLTSPAHQ